MKRFLQNVQMAFNPTDQEFQLLTNRMKVVFLNKNELFLREGEVSNRVGFVERGSLRQFYGAADREYCNNFYFENSIVCSFPSLLSQQNSEINIAAIEKCELLVFDYRDIQEMMSTSPTLREFAQFILQEHLLHSERREAELLRLTPEERFKRLLEIHPKIFKRVPLHYVASYLNITPETLSRYRAKLI